MPAYNAVNAARIAAVPSTKAAPGQVKGDVLFAYDEYTSLANLLAADTINTGIVIPAGAKIKAVIVTSPLNGGTMSVGIAGSTSKYVTTAAANATTTTVVLADVTVDETLIVTMGAATAVGLYKIAVEFIRN